MKRSVFIILLTIVNLITIDAKPGKLFGWFHISPKVGFGGSLVTNSSMFDYDNVNPKIFNPTYSFGGQLGVAFVDVLDISFEVNREVLNQNYEIRLDDIRYDKNYRMIDLEYGVLLRYLSRTGFYELGVMSADLKDIHAENDILTNQMASEPDFSDNEDFFGSKYYNFIAGFGASLYQDGLFEITLGLRFKYRLQAMSGPELPIQDGVYPTNFSSDSQSHQMALTLDFQVHNFFGFFGRTICGGRSVMFFQQPKKLW